MTGAPRVGLDEGDLLRARCYVGGQWVAHDGAPIPVDDPYTQSVFAEVPSLGAAATHRAISAAADAFPAWAAKRARERGAVLRRWLELLLHHRDDIARLIVLENGKVWKEAQAEIDYGAAFLEFYADEATRSIGQIIPPASPGRRMLVDREPVGVCAAITPWNFPLAMLTRKAAPALAAGCTMVAKPAEATPLTALALAKLGEEAGVPAGVFNVITGSPVAIGSALTASAIVRKLSFTGSTAVGTMLAAACAPTMKRLGLELGGNAPLLIFDDADLGHAVETAMVAKFRNGGQSCIAANRIYVQTGIKDRFLAAFAARVSAIKSGDGFAETSDIGPMINAASVAKLAQHQADALAGGAQILAGGGDAQGRLVPCTMLANVAPNALLTREETFGPLAGVMSFDSVEQAITLANDTPFGLAAYLCAQDPALIARVSRALETGMVGINTGLISSAHAPFGGVKMSGLGREGSAYGLAEYQNLKYLCEGGL